MHFTINKSDSLPGAPGMGEETQYVVGHSLGGGWMRHIVELGKGDTADNPASTKGPLYGPALVVYDIAPSGITIGVYDGAKGFYDSIIEHARQFGSRSEESDLT